MLDMNKALSTVAPGVVERLNAIPEMRHQINVLKSQMAAYERELDESRRLNLRAAEILDVTYAQLLGEAVKLDGLDKEEMLEKAEEIKAASRASSSDGKKKTGTTSQSDSSKPSSKANNASSSAKNVGNKNSPKNSSSKKR